ncbi:MAG: GAF domain-containing protein, partial [Solirubrobacterales bacterium]|nr:GAF domain-containing protein [Solirubrobacterales bacterium]
TRSAAETMLDAHRAVATALDQELDRLRATSAPADRPSADSVIELQAMARSLTEGIAIPRLQASERVRAALERLAGLGPVSELLDRGPIEASEAAQLDRTLLSRVNDGWLVAEALHHRGEPTSATATLERLRSAPVRLDYPVIEGEVMRRRHPLIVRATDDPTRSAHGDVMGWRDYLAAPVVLDGRVIGFFQGDRLASGERLETIDRDALWQFTQGFAEVFERAVLRRRLRIQREELRQVASWADARTSELSDRAIDLAIERETGPTDRRGRPPESPDFRLRELLTRRELEVLEHLVTGETNAAIARDLVVSEGTVKFHVKNVLRKLHASNRAEATSRYLRLTLRPNEASDARGLDRG